MVAHDILYRSDFWGRLILQRMRLSPLKVALFVLVYYLLFPPLGDLFVQRTYSGRFIGLFESYEFIDYVVSFLLLSPLIWWFYSWQLVSVPAIYSKLVYNKVLGQPLNADKWNSLEQYMKIKLAIPMSSRWLRGFAMVVIVIGAMFFTIVELERVATGSPKWYLVYYWLYFLLYLLPAMISAYLMLLASLRQILVVSFSYVIFQDFQVTVHAMHPDSVGGFSPVGAFSTKLGILVLAVGIWVNTIVFATALYGLTPEFNVYTLGSYIFYIVLGPLLVVTPIIGAHKVMVATKQQELQKVADAFNRLFVQSQNDLANVHDDELLNSRNEILDELKRRYALVKGTYPTTPFSTPQIRGLGISGIIPLIPGIVLNAVELYNQYLKAP